MKYTYIFNFTINLNKINVFTLNIERKDKKTRYLLKKFHF